MLNRPSLYFGLELLQLAADLKHLPEVISESRSWRRLLFMKLLRALQSRSVSSCGVWAMKSANQSDLMRNHNLSIGL